MSNTAAVMLELGSIEVQDAGCPLISPHKVGVEISQVQVGDLVAIEPGTRCRGCSADRYHLCPTLKLLAAQTVELQLPNLNSEGMAIGLENRYAHFGSIAVTLIGRVPNPIKAIISRPRTRQSW